MIQYSALKEGWAGPCPLPSELDASHLVSHRDSQPFQVVNRRQLSLETRCLAEAVVKSMLNDRSNTGIRFLDAWKAPHDAAGNHSKRKSLWTCALSPRRRALHRRYRSGAATIVTVRPDTPRGNDTEMQQNPLDMPPPRSYPR